MDGVVSSDSVDAHAAKIATDAYNNGYYKTWFVLACS